MDPSSAQHHQEMGSQTLESMLVCTKSQLQDKKPRPQPEQSLKCPRCDSTNTKFCYYNNYSLSQPRYFCKSCRRYWTKGGTLRNVPVGGGCRKNKRSSSSSKIRSQDQGLSANPSPQLSPLPGLTYDSSDLSLAFARLQKQSTGQLGFDGHDLSMMGNHNTTHCDVLGQGSNGFFDALRGGFIDAQNGFHTLYYGNNIGHGENGVGINCNNEEMGILGYHDQDHHNMRDVTTTAVTVTSVKQEYCNGREGESKVLWGFPWQIGGDHGNIADFENSGRESWNGIGSSWHGLLNSPLM